MPRFEVWWTPPVWIIAEDRAPLEDDPVIVEALRGGASYPAVSKTFGIERKPKAPAHLAEPTKRWWRNVVKDYVLDEHHIRLLTLAAESFDRCVQARGAIEHDGAFITDRFGVLKAHPGIAVERDSRIAFCRILRELDLDVEPPSASPQPPLLHRYGGKN